MGQKKKVSLQDFLHGLVTTTNQKDKCITSQLNVITLFHDLIAMVFLEESQYKTQLPSFSSL